ncbi:1,4-dihydroxy-2-naphthoate polyprenyltransferase [Leptobacterium flavescens]|uniref:1,4-dihydroxy-2-naphthoate octaprenyltransferase n=1 Tax=Leptobacterium flavescens TaxID=472055 RepID=A0A6P0UKI5_9FLAO|nr:1,4-dihydroxy-2-naphthoate polyprenyltransferase [Leptobacterium flavescens]NER13881.1 1,4-dihydroxy-2-naphthoate polyprenyltransferase [Leptobacterium flavescens]
MTKTKAWLSAARLRTLPLSVSGIIVGAGLAHSKGQFDTLIFVLAILTTIGFQVLSNFANDYGDGVKGTDNEERVGPERAIQSGAIQPREMKKGMIITTVITLIIAGLLIYTAFGKENLWYTLIFLLLGIASIAAAIKYTVGKSAYGYHGFGDIFVFVFFGLLSVTGSYFLFTKELNALIFLPAITVGLLSVAVLNLNNMRDRESDARSGKNTLVVKMGEKFARIYHFSLIILAMAATVVYTIRAGEGTLLGFVYMLAYIPLIIHLLKLSRTKDLKTLDPELKKIALSTFLFAILFLFS